MMKVSMAIRTMLQPVSAFNTFFLFVLLMSYTIGIVGNFVGAQSDGFLNFLLNISDSYLLCLLLLAIKYILGRFHIVYNIVKWIIQGLAGIILYAELFVVFFYHSLISVHVMQLLFETNSSESSEFISSALSSSAFLLSVIVTAVVFTVSLLASRKLSNISQGKATDALRYITVFLVLWSVIRQVPLYINMGMCFHAEDTSFCEKKKDEMHFNTPMIRLLFGIAFHKASGLELSVLEETVKNSRISSCSYRCPLIVLVIGESYNKYHSHLYNRAYLNTTPNLDKLEKSGNLVKFTDAITPYNMTTHVFKNLFSMFDGLGMENTEDDSWIHHSLFTALFKKAGYNVYFLTNQFVPDSNDDWDAMGGNFMNNRKLSALQFSHRNKKKYKYDGQLLSELPDIKTLEKEPTLLIVHLIGQHVGYKDRYPENFEKYNSSVSHTRFGGGEGKKTEAEYANATLYNDYVVNKVFKAIGRTDAIGIYIADHGEEVYDWRDTYERTQERPIPDKVMRYQYEIPMVVYLTNSFKQNHPDIVEKVIAAKDFPIVNTNLSHSLVWLGGIDTPEYSEKLDFFSPSYDKKRKRMLWNSIPYRKS